MNRKHVNAFNAPVSNLDTSLEAQSNIVPFAFDDPCLLHHGRQAIQPRVSQRLGRLC
jgi:hypothetical protein